MALFDLDLCLQGHTSNLQTIDNQCPKYESLTYLLKCRRYKPYIHILSILTLTVDSKCHISSLKPLLTNTHLWQSVCKIWTTYIKVHPSIDSILVFFVLKRCNRLINNLVLIFSHLAEREREREREIERERERFVTVALHGLILD